MRTLTRLTVLWLPVIVYCGLIYGFSAQPLEEEEFLPVPQLDKVLHVIEYAILAILLMRALSGSWLWRSSGALAGAVIVLASLYGGLDEWHQSFVPLRHPSVFDWAFDSLGAWVGQRSWWRKR